MTNWRRLLILLSLITCHLYALSTLVFFAVLIFVVLFALNRKKLEEAVV